MQAGISECEDEISDYLSYQGITFISLPHQGGPASNSGMDSSEDSKSNIMSRDAWSVGHP